MTRRPDNAVGYGRPPKGSQFPPGQSGNPLGRPKGRRNFFTELCDELNTPTTVTEDGQPVMVSKQRAVIRRLVNTAIAGDVRAITTVLALCTRLAAEETDQDRPPALEVLADLEDDAETDQLSGAQAPATRIEEEKSK